MIQEGREAKDLSAFFMHKFVTGATLLQLMYPLYVFPHFIKKNVKPQIK
jgi:hypothetical protein